MPYLKVRSSGFESVLGQHCSTTAIAFNLKVYFMEKIFYKKSMGATFRALILTGKEFALIDSAWNFTWITKNYIILETFEGGKPIYTGSFPMGLLESEEPAELILPIKWPFFKTKNCTKVNEIKGSMCQLIEGKKKKKTVIFYCSI